MYVKCLKYVNARVDTISFGKHSSRLKTARPRAWRGHSSVFWYWRQCWIMRAWPEQPRSRSTW